MLENRSTNTETKITGENTKIAKRISEIAAHENLSAIKPTDARDRNTE